MIKIVVKMIVKEDKIDEFQAMAEEIVQKSQAEPGNISYTLNQGIDDKKQHVLIEIWKDQAAIDIHNATEHFTTILPKMLELTEGEHPIEKFTEVNW